MRFAKTLLAAALILVPGKAFSEGRFNTVDLGNIILQMSDGREYLQTGLFNIEFRAGELFVEVRDGFVTIAACSGNGGPILLAPQIGCALGTTAFVSEGDFDNDGIRDDLAYYSAVEVAPALLIAALRPDLVTLESRPFGAIDLTGQTGLFNDRSVLVFFNVLTGLIQQYEITFYDFVRSYGAGPGERSRMKDEVRSGAYGFNFPLLDNEPVTIPIGVTLYQPPKVFDPTDLAVDSDRHFRFVSGVYSPDGYYLMDHRLTNLVRWKGIRFTNTYPLLDEYRLSIFAYDADTDSTGEILFPPNGVPILLDYQDVIEDTGPGWFNSVEAREEAAGGYNIPPFFFSVGQEALFQLRLDRLIPTTVASYDTSCRLLNVRVRFIDSYDGFSLVGFPAGTSSSDRAAAADFDEDMWTNLEEFAFGRQEEVYEPNPDTGEIVLTEINLIPDPADPSSTPETEGTYPVVEEDPDNAGKVLITLTKRAFTEGVLEYTLNAKIKDGEFMPVLDNPAEWEVVENSVTDSTPGALPGDPPTYQPGMLVVRSVNDLVPDDVMIDVGLKLLPFRN